MSEGAGDVHGCIQANGASNERAETIPGILRNTC